MNAVENCYSHQLPNSQIASLSRSNPQRHRNYATGRRAIWGFESSPLSIAALNWAFEIQELSSSRKFVLVALADYASECGTCWPSTDTLCRKTCLDRKTIVAALDSLLETGLIVDTGKRSGATAQIKVYRLKMPVESKAPKNGIVAESKAPVFPIEGSQKRESEGSQKRDTEPSVEPSRNHQVHRTSLKFTKPSLEEVQLIIAKTGLPETDGIWFWNKCEGNGWTNGGKPIRSWPHTIASWKAAGYMPSQKLSGHPQKPVTTRDEIELQIRRLSADLPVLEIKKSPEWQPTREKIWKLQDQLKSM